MRLRRITAASGVLLVGLALAACQGGDEQQPEGDATTTASAEPTEEPTDAGTGDGSSAPPEQLVQVAVDDLAEREGADPADVEPGTLEQVTWPDGSVGCPIPGTAYTQALVEGTRLVLTLDGTEYAYHGEGDQPLEYCADPTDPVPNDDATG